MMLHPEVQDLRTAIAYLEQDPAEILRIREEVDPKYQLGAIAEKLYGGPGLIFEKVKGFDVPVVSNLFSKGRLAKLFGTTPDRLASKLIEAVRATLATPLAPQIVATGPCKEVIVRENIDLNAMFPIPWLTPRDCGNYLGASLIVCKDAETVERIMFWARGTVRSAEKLHL
ncbi:MAG: UbiD family decarboxylase, partial [Chloroflexi bacterium]|nr:UbiD family decarboxylase [Chloroflexota bacterium]